MTGFGHPGQPEPLRRRGPRPLLLHLTLAIWRNCCDASTPWNSVWPAMSAALQAGGRAPAADRRAGDPAEDPPPPADLAALFGAAAQHDAALIRGIAAYRRHPDRRALADPPSVWTEGDTSLLDYGAKLPAGTPTVLFVPSLVNRAYVLDLAEGRSMMRWLAGQGLRPLLLDWGWPGAAERRFSLTDYVAGRLERALVAATGMAADRVVLAGYCMGGTLAVAAAQRRPDLLRGLALLAAPWDFHAGGDPEIGDCGGAGPPIGALAARILPLLEPAMALSGTLSIDLLQTLFALLDPHGVADKYRAFARLDPASTRARLFVALEDWLADGVPLGAVVGREVLASWYGANDCARGAWRIAGLPVDPSASHLPAFVAAPARDRIVPPESAIALARAIPGAVLHRPGAGHVGMVAGTAAERALWRPLRDWIATL